MLAAGFWVLCSADVSGHIVLVFAQYTIKEILLSYELRFFSPHGFQVSNVQRSRLNAREIRKRSNIE